MTPVIVWAIAVLELQNAALPDGAQRVLTLTGAGVVTILSAIEWFSLRSTYGLSIRGGPEPTRQPFPTNGVVVDIDPVGGHGLIDTGEDHVLFPAHELTAPVGVGTRVEFRRGMPRPESKALRVRPIPAEGD